MKKFIAYYAIDNEMDYFDSYEEAEKWLQEFYVDEISEETQSGMDFIAEIKAVSKFIITQDRDKDGYKWNEEASGYFINADPEEDQWVSEYDKLGEVKLEKIND